MHSFYVGTVGNLYLRPHILYTSKSFFYLYSYFLFIFHIHTHTHKITDVGTQTHRRGNFLFQHLPPEKYANASKFDELSLKINELNAQIKVSSSCCCAVTHACVTIVGV